MSRKVYITMIATTVLFSGIWLFFYNAGTQEVGDSDMVVVFGNRVNIDGTLSPWLQSRLDTTIDYLRDHDTKKIFVSGGFGKEGHREAEVMKDYILTQRTGQADTIIVDNSGDNTLATVRNALVFAHKNEYTHIVWISSYHHIPRIQQVVEHIGSPSISHEYYPDQTLHRRDLYSMGREIAALVALKVRGIRG